jgi:hypothetical protein
MVLTSTSQKLADDADDEDVLTTYLTRKYSGIAKDDDDAARGYLSRTYRKIKIKHGKDFAAASYLSRTYKKLSVEAEKTAAGGNLSRAYKPVTEEESAVPTYLARTHATSAAEERDARVAAEEDDAVVAYLKDAYARVKDKDAVHLYLKRTYKRIAYEEDAVPTYLARAYAKIAAEENNEISTYLSQTYENIAEEGAVTAYLKRKFEKIVDEEARDAAEEVEARTKHEATEREERGASQRMADEERRDHEYDEAMAAMQKEKEMGKHEPRKQEEAVQQQQRIEAEYVQEQARVQEQERRDREFDEAVRENRELREEAARVAVDRAKEQEADDLAAKQLEECMRNEACSKEQIDEACSKEQIDEACSKEQIDEACSKEQIDEACSIDAADRTREAAEVHLRREALEKEPEEWVRNEAYAEQRGDALQQKLREKEEVIKREREVDIRREEQKNAKLRVRDAYEESHTTEIASPAVVPSFLPKMFAITAHTSPFRSLPSMLPLPTAGISSSVPAFPARRAEVNDSMPISTHRISNIRIGSRSFEEAPTLSLFSSPQRTTPKKRLDMDQARQADNEFPKYIYSW